MTRCCSPNRFSQIWTDLQQNGSNRLASAQTWNTFQIRTVLQQEMALIASPLLNCGLSSSTNGLNRLASAQIWAILQQNGPDRLASAQIWTILQQEMALIASPLLKYGLSSSRVALIASPPRCGQVCSPNPCNQAGDSRGTCQVRDGLQLQSLLRMLLQL